MPERESYLVIGGCGFLGRHIVEQLLARGETEVAVFDIVQRHFDTYVPSAGRETKLMYRNVTFYIGDITKPDDVRNAINKVSLERVNIT
jgi:sterol-4alpha-carboxylate 3-dehydrogenase (decarboxylating)